MAITYVGSSNHVNGPDALVWPAGHQAGDIAIIVSSNSTAQNIPSGWNAIYRGLGGSDINITLLWRRATSSSEASVAVPGPATQWAAQMSVWRGCIGTGSPIATLGTGGGLSTSSLTQFTLSALAISASGTTVLGAAVSRSSTAVISHSWGGAFAEVFDQCVGAGSSALTMAYCTFTGSSSTGSVIVSGLGSSSKSSNAFLFSLVAAAAPITTSGKKSAAVSC